MTLMQYLRFALISTALTIALPAMSGETASGEAYQCCPLVAVCVVVVVVVMLTLFLLSLLPS